MIKISRDVSLIKFRKFPLRSFEKDTEVSYYPTITSMHWLKLEHKSSKGLTNILSEQITKLYKNLDSNYLIFLCDYNRFWVSKFTAERNDSLALSKAVEYFAMHKIGGRFNGAVKVDIAELPEFLKHYYVITRCDGDFAYYHFLDENQNLLGFIHFSGDVRFDVLNENFEPLFLSELHKTSFQKVDL